MSWTGRALERLDDRPLLNGAARFSVDLEPVGHALQAAVVRSPVPHASVGAIDGDRALRSPGCVAVITAQDLPAGCRPVPNILRPDHQMPLLATDTVRYVGEPVALVLALDRAGAEDAASLVEVELTELDANAVIDDGEVVHDRTFGFGLDTPDPVDADPIDVGFEAVYPRSTAMPLETWDITAEHDPDSGRYTIWANYGGPMALHAVVAGCLGVAPGDVRLVVPDRIGGNFGVKQAMYPMMALVAAAAACVGRPVRWTEDRAENLIASTGGSERRTRIGGSFSDDGVLHALDIAQAENFGAYIRTPEPAGLYRMHGNLNGPYRVPRITLHNTAVLTNQVPSGLNRGFGAPQLFHALESTMDAAARTLGVDRAELRRRNLVRSDEFPYPCPSGAELDSGDYGAVLDRACALARWDDRSTEMAAARRAGRAVGLGIGCSVETSGNNLGYMNLAADPDSPMARVPKSGAGATASVTVDPAGAVTVHVDSPDCGQGYRTVVAQVAADELGLAPADVRVETGLDSSSGGWLLTSGNYANRFSTAVVSAVARAARDAASQLRIVAGEALGASPEQVVLSGGVASAPTTEHTLPIRRLGSQPHWDLGHLPAGIDGPIRAGATYTLDRLRRPDDGSISTSFTYSFQCDIAAVEVDRATGVVTVIDYTTVHDAGTVLHPGMFDGQVMGGLAHGLAAALGEHLDYSPDGMPGATDLRRYGPIRARDMPPVPIDRIETPSPHTEHGAKGLGDGCAILAPTVIASAIADALELDTNPTPPFTPDRVWHLAQTAAVER